MSERQQSFIPPQEDLPPEADRFEDWPHPREMLQCFGHEKAQQEMVDAFASRHMHHAWIFSGPEGIGKATLAYRIARFVLASEKERAGDPDDIMSGAERVGNRQIASRAHPGLLTIRRVWNEKTKKLSTIIPVDEVRKLKGFLQHTSAGENAWRVVIVDQADDLNISAANALLKSLEEPPANCLFLLISSDPGRLLPTIRSRCRMLELSPLRTSDLERAAGAVMSTETQSADARLMALADGRVRRYLALCAGDGLKYYDEMLALLRSLPDLDERHLLKLSDELSALAARQSFEIFYDLLFATLARLIRISATSGEMVVEDKDGCGHLISKTSLAEWARLWETIAAEKADIARLNLDRKAFVLDTFHQMRALMRRAA